MNFKNTDHLPRTLRGAYVHFNNALLRWHGISIRPRTYLKLTRLAANQPCRPAHGGRVYVTLTLDGRELDCIYDPRDFGALITVFRPRGRA